MRGGYPRGARPLGASRSFFAVGTVYSDTIAETATASDTLTGLLAMAMALTETGTAADSYSAPFGSIWNVITAASPAWTAQTAADSEWTLQSAPSASWTIVE
jgi:hypothetical protein